MQNNRIFHLLAEAFMQEGISHCFALLGDANMNWAAALADRGCDFTYVRDEHCAVAAAMSWARVTARPGIATVTCGPGVTQILTALPAAVRAKIPLVIFAGEAPLGKAWYNQQLEQRSLIETCGASYVSLHHPATMTTQVRDAFLHARTTSQPVVLGVPADLQEQICESNMVYAESSLRLMPEHKPAPPNPDAVKDAAALIRQAGKVIVMAGRGAVSSGAIDACRELAAAVNGLLATTLPARGAFYNDPFSIGISGGFSSDTARRCLQEADLIVAVGCSLASHNSDNGKLFEAHKVLHIDLDPLSHSQGRVVAQHHMRCDARLGVECIVASLSNNKTASDSDTGWRTVQLAKEIRTAPADSSVFDIANGQLDPRDVVTELENTLPQEWFMVNSSGHCSYFFAQMPSRPVDRFLTIREFGAIGNGIAFAIGVAVANPDKTVVLFDGDGSLLMHVQELETIKRHKLNILICVMNDGAYGSEIHKLRAEGLSDQGAVFGYCDFGSIARGFGIDGAVVDDLTALPSLVDEFAQNRGAAVWDFHVSDQVVSPVIRRSHTTN